jgi:hypothetical protein
MPDAGCRMPELTTMIVTPPNTVPNVAPSGVRCRPAIRGVAREAGPAGTARLHSDSDVSLAYVDMLATSV